MATTRHVKLIDRHNSLVATAILVDEGDHYGGSIDLRMTPPEIRALFAEFEEIINGQMFAFLDDIQDKIAELSLRALFEDGAEADIQDLQVFPSAGEVSLRLARVPSHAVALPESDSAAS
jgi:hypothetical protein